MNEYMDIPFEVKSEDVQENGIFKGYGSTFGGKPDSYGEVVVEGAFGKSLEKGGRNGFGVSMLWQHNSNEVPGVWSSIAENKKGLLMEGRLALNTQLGNDAYELLKLGALRGLSIGYQVKLEEYDKDKNIRYLKEIELWEVSLVTFPANTRAQVTNVKAIEEAQTERELEMALRESGLSKKVSQLVVKKLKSYSGGIRNRDSLETMLPVVKQQNNYLLWNDIKTTIEEVNHAFRGH